MCRNLLHVVLTETMRYKFVKLRVAEIEHFLEDYDQEYQPHLKTKPKKKNSDEFDVEQEQKHEKISNRRVGHQRNVDLY